ncbi:unnamed protein product [Microthlaspi erraticum]|uniref:NYN domain-containing protein n=1 Tax=Microthlaspi erraticum TaxID=1685480 RepID=A0A6D2IDZ4_9BRAS|nr:unnamed protein product [Microthlaspi erraticum]
MSVTNDLYSWTNNNPPPATLILISDAEGPFVDSGILPGLIEDGYTIGRAFKKHPAKSPEYASQSTLWDYLLSVTAQNGKGNVKGNVKEKRKTAWVCNICIDSGYPFAGESFESWKKHSKTPQHRYQEWTHDEPTMEGQSEASVEATISNEDGVWWDLDTLLLPEQIKPYQARQSIESTFPEHSPFIISAIGNLNNISDDVLEPILSAGPEDMTDDIGNWVWNTPPPATLILISDHEEAFVKDGFLPGLKDKGYTIIRAYLRFPDFNPAYASIVMSWGFVLSEKPAPIVLSTSPRP